MNDFQQFDVYPGGVLFLDESLKIFHATSKFCELFECQPEEISGQLLENLFSPKDRKGTLAYHNKLSQYEKGFLDIVIALLINHKEFFTRLRMIKKKQQWVAIFEDILAEIDDLFHRFHLGKERWTGIVRNSSEGIAMLDTEGRLVEFNSKFLELMQFRSSHGVLLNEEALLNRKLFALLQHEEFEEVEAAFEKARTKRRLKFSKEFPYEQYYFNVELTSIHLPVKGFVGCGLVMKDITAHQQLEIMMQQLHQKNQELEIQKQALQAAHQAISHINQVAKTVNSSLDLDEVMQLMIEALRKVVQFDLICIAMIDENTQELALDRVYGDMLVPEIVAHLKHIRIPLARQENYFVKTVLRTAPVYIPEITPEITELCDGQDCQFCQLNSLKGILLYPLEIQKRVIGVLAFGKRHQSFALTEDEIAKIQQYVLQIATAINNARLYAELGTTKIQLAETERIVALTNRLQEKEIEYYTLVENINLGVYRNTDEIHGKFLQANHALAWMFGYHSVEELMNIPVSQLYVDPEERKQFVAILRSQGECRGLQLRLKKRDGTQIWASVNAAVQYDHNGQIKWIDGVVEDITERKNMEDALSESEMTLRTIMESANDAIVSIDPKGDIISWNNAAEKIFGYTAEEVLHQSLTLVIPERYRDAHQKGIERVNSTGETHVIGTTVELSGLKKDGSEFPLELSLAICQTETDKFYNGIIRDITERKKAEKKLQQINKTFECFVPKQFLNRLAKEGIENIGLGKAESTTISILFSDIRSFTSLSEDISPQELLNFLNAYFKRMNEPIHTHHGFVDKFIGDAIMALFPENPENALRAAIKMGRELELYNEERKRAGYDSIQAGFGLHRGTVTMGTVGSEDRMDTTVIGDAVNLTSRLESLTKVFKITILLSSAVYNHLPCADDFYLREIDTVRVKGKQAPVILYEAFDNDTPHVLEKKQQALAAFRQAMSHYKTGTFRDALELFRTCQELCPEDSIPPIYITRCHTLLRVPPGPGWAGVSTL